MILIFVTLSLPMNIYHVPVLETTPQTAPQSGSGVNKTAMFTSIKVPVLERQMDSNRSQIIPFPALHRFHSRTLSRI